MRIRRAILYFLHEKVFGHDRGDESNKFTKLIYAVLMPIWYIVDHNTKLRYDITSDIYTIEGMEFSGALLRSINDLYNSPFEEERNLLWNNYVRLIDGSLKGADIIKIPTLNIEMKLIDEPKSFASKMVEMQNEVNLHNRKKREETMKSNIGIAKVCHEAHRQYCIDNKLPTQALWDELPETQQNSIIHGVRQVIAYPSITSTEMHEAWMKHKASEGWKYAKVLDVKNKTHPNMLPFNKLPEGERGKDMLFIKTVKREMKK